MPSTSHSVAVLFSTYETPACIEYQPVLLWLVQLHEYAADGEVQVIDKDMELSIPIRELYTQGMWWEDFEGLEACSSMLGYENGFSEP